MAKPEKVQAVQELRDRLQRATIVISTSYSGLRVQEMNQLRSRLRAAGLELKVVKNTLLRLAAEEGAQSDLMRIVAGPTALAFAYSDSTEAAKALTAYAQAAPPTFAIQGAFLDGSLLSAADLRDLVNLPPKPVLLSLFLGQLQSPLATFLGLLEAPLQELSLLLQATLGELPALLEARARQLEATQ